MALSRHRELHRICLLLAQSGHPQFAPNSLLAKELPRGRAVGVKSNHRRRVEPAAFLLGRIPH
jgi:hypothetical protein